MNTYCIGRIPARYVVVLLALLMNLIFLYWYNPLYHYTISQLHGQVGYNINTYGSVCINQDLARVAESRRQIQGHLVDYNTFNASDFSYPAQPFITNDTIGYGLVLGLLWKITGSFSFRDVQWLQLILFVLLMLCLYRIVSILFGSEHMAFIACVVHLLYFPLIAMNVQPVRDIWAYYGIVILLYGVVEYLLGQGDVWRMGMCGVGFSVCQFVRPSVFLALCTLSCVVIIYGWIYRKKLKKIITLLTLVWCSNLLFFWIPFCTYNKLSYDRYFVGPVGLDLLEGLGEFSNPWGYKLDDVWASDYISKKYNVIFGTPAFDDKAKEEFAQAFAQAPHIYCLNIFKRIPGLLLPGLPWIFYVHSPYGAVCSWRDKIMAIAGSWDLFKDFILRHVYIRLYLVLGYLGALMLFWHRRYWVLALLFAGVLLGGLGKLPSHIEYRYIVPYYWVFGISLTYGFFCLIKKYSTMLKA